MVLFEKPGRHNSEEAVQIACRKAKELGSYVVVATGSGDTPKIALKELEALGMADRLIVVGSVYDFRTIPQGGNKMSEETRAEFAKAGVPVVFATHVLSGVERGLSGGFSGIYPAEIIAHTLRMFGQGVKVCVECAIMALDAGLLPYGMPVVGVGGTGKGADTACVLPPGHGNNVMSTRIHEILCKPSLYGEK